MKKMLAAPLAGALAAVVASGTVLAGDAVTYEVNRQDFTIPKALTDKPGDPMNGREVAVNRKKGNCLACHRMPITDQQFHGAIGPPLHGVGKRYTAAQLRLRVVDSKVINPGTIMPAFYRKDGLHRVMKKFQGKTILSAQEVEDVVAYLTTLK